MIQQLSSEYHITNTLLIFLRVFDGTLSKSITEILRSIFKMIFPVRFDLINTLYSVCFDIARKNKSCGNT